MAASVLDLTTLKFNEDGLIAAIAQEAATGEVLMMAWMDRTALERTIATRQATYFSRSRQRLWVKGETSGNTQAVVTMSVDCDRDVVLLRVLQTGPACHTGSATCFSGREVQL